ncbi:type II CAAX prenyl endopeptidase Rce1 family protein [Microbacterium koreense]|uniref:Type II CAAX prenyl endopeptidase Rce1 family protein n=1 Tax=Microbacterium koreense TaxID=323761 RepID=A0ABW2ZMT0_9MICO
MTTNDFWQNREGFWNRGGFWKAILVAGVYLALFLGASWILGTAFRGSLDRSSPFASVADVLVLLLAPEVIGSVIILVFLASIGWLGPLFRRQPVEGRGWMWIAVAIVALPVVLRLIGLDYGAYAAGVVPLTLFAGLFIGLTEELVTRGAALGLLRKGGYSERIAAVVAAAIFALMHSVDSIGSGLSWGTLILVTYAFFFGICMYLVMRVTGNILWAILLHALTDPTLFLANGDIDASSSTAHQDVFLSIASFGNVVVIGFGVVALFLIRGRVLEAPALR